MKINNPVQTRLAESELEEMAKLCEKVGVKPAAFLREKYRKGLAEDTLELMLLHTLNSHRKQIESTTQKQIEEADNRLMEAFDKRLADFQLQLFRNLEERLEALVVELKE